MSQDRNSTGAAVRDLQYTLYELKYYDGDITGVYDERTENAVRNFQEVQGGLELDGKAGAQTLRLLYSSEAEPVTGIAE
jgi:peptidoglycan hydrolase-like protein with peptidoglycan-binding domain